MFVVRQLFFERFLESLQDPQDVYSSIAWCRGVEGLQLCVVSELYLCCDDGKDDVKQDGHLGKPSSSK